MTAVVLVVSGLVCVALFLLTMAALYDRIKALEARIDVVEKTEGLEIHKVRA